MRRIHIIRGDFPLFHQDISPIDYEFFRNHAEAFKRMWNEQKRVFWRAFLDTFDDFIWNYGVMKDFPLKIEDKKQHIEEIISLLRLSFVDGTATSAKAIITDCVLLAQNRHHVGSLDKASYSQNPFFMKETRETFRKLFGPPNSKFTFVKLLCGLPVYIKFAGAAVTVLRRWLFADEIHDEYLEQKYLLDLRRLKLEEQPVSGFIPDQKCIVEKLTEKPILRVERTRDISLNLDDLAPPGVKLTSKSEYKATSKLTVDVSYSFTDSVVTKDKHDDNQVISETKKKKKKKKKREEKPESETLPSQKQISSSDKILDEQPLEDESVTTAPTKNTEDIETVEKITTSGERNEVKYKLHDCSRCGKMEEVVKSFKRCIKCRGKPNPKYYCTKECQVTDWKAGHRLEHKDDEDEN